MQKRLFFFMLVMISLILRSGLALSSFETKSKVVLSKKMDFSGNKEFPATSNSSIEEDEEEDEDETIRKSKNQYLEESDLERKELVFQFFPPSSKSSFLLPDHFVESIHKTPYSPPDFGVNKS